MQVNIIVQQIFILIILALIGVIATKVNIIQRETKNGISRLIFNITLPFLIITRISSLDINKDVLLSWGMMIIITAFTIILFLNIGRLTSRLLKLPPKKATVHILHSGFGNIVFLGFPILDALFPQEGLLYGIIYFLTQNTLTWTVGIFILTREKQQSKLRHLKKLLNPNTISFFIGLTMLLAGIQIPEFLFGSLQGLGQTTIYLAMLYIGALLADINLKSIGNQTSTFVLSIQKLLIGPIAIIFLIKLIMMWIPFDIAQTALRVIILESAMPCGTIMVILARQYNKDDFYATQNMSVSTLLSIITLPFIFFLSQIIL
ncbi:MAG: AEC family transporter [Bacteroidales bacterium]